MSFARTCTLLVGAFELNTFEEVALCYIWSHPVYSAATVARLDNCEGG